MRAFVAVSRVFFPCCVLVFPLHLLLSVFLPLLQSASQIAASPKVSAKVKKDNVKYAAWAASQINRAYKVCDILWCICAQHLQHQKSPYLHNVLESLAVQSDCK